MAAVVQDIAAKMAPLTYNLTNASLIANQAFKRRYVYNKDVVDAAAGDAMVDSLIFMTSAPVRINTILVLPYAALTADATDAVNVIFKKGTLAAGALTTMFTSSSDADIVETAIIKRSGSWVARTAITCDLTAGVAATCSLAADEGLWVAIAKIGAGKVVPRCSFIVSAYDYVDA